MSSVEDVRRQLIDANMPDAFIESIMKSLNKPEKKEKKRGFFPGMATPVELIDVKVTIICELCGDKQVEVRQIKSKKGAPTKMRLPRAVCEHCPTYLREFTFEQLVSLVIVKEHPAVMTQYKTNTAHVKFAKKYTPEELVNINLGGSL